ncbi:hypothetical protein [Thalassospira sp.]|uniref:hypothetical protein n=1 Tax=Thalassospira sp. TaxID=1912094 RepID=UPI003AA836A5
MRGSLKNALGEPFERAKKHAEICLLETTPIWHYLLLQEDDGKPVRSIVANQFAEYKRQIKDFSDRQLIYFIGMRPRIRLYDQIRYARFSKKIIIPLEIGPQRQRVKAKVLFAAQDDNGAIKRVNISNDATMITQEWDENLIKEPLHYFLDKCGIDLGHSSRVAYVGRTDNPNIRAIDGNHRGLSDTLGLSKETDEDVFIHYNVFHLRYHAEATNTGINFQVSNSLIDHIDAKSEAGLIELMFIDYFEPDTMKWSMPDYRISLRKKLLELNETYNVSAVTASYDLEHVSSLYRLAGNRFGTRDNHIFRYNIENDYITSELLEDLDF